jgi:hypothetical protein
MTHGQKIYMTLTTGLYDPENKFMTQMCQVTIKPVI